MKKIIISVSVIFGIVFISALSILLYWIGIAYNLPLKDSCYNIAIINCSSQNIDNIKICYSFDDDIGGKELQSLASNETIYLNVNTENSKKLENSIKVTLGNGEEPFYSTAFRRGVGGISRLYITNEETYIKHYSLNKTFLGKMLFAKDILKERHLGNIKIYYDEY